MNDFSAGKDTIAAVSTPLGESGIGIVRLSGSRALNIADAVFRGRNGRKPSQLPTFSVRYGHIVAPESGVIDEVLLTVMRGPRTYTREDIVEINCHGGIVPLRSVLELVIRKGARPAGPGEFTQRAFLNGRIDLVQAESALNIIQAKTQTALRASVNQLSGALTERIRGLRRELIEIIAPLEASLDFPDEEIDVPRARLLRKELKAAQEKAASLLKSARRGMLIQHGISAVITGRPNTGKSSLMNALAGYDRVIVTRVAGTTRDVVEETITVGELPVRIADTAGIAGGRGVIARESAGRSLAAVGTADLVLLVIDASAALTRRDLDLARRIKPKRVCIVANKIDLAPRANLELLKKELPAAPLVKISALKKTGLNRLKERVRRMFLKGKINKNDEMFVLNVRQSRALEKCAGGLHNAQALGRGREECLVFELRQAIDALNEIIGENAAEDILDAVFSRFCVGK